MILSILFYWGCISIHIIINIFHFQFYYHCCLKLKHKQIIILTLHFQMHPNTRIEITKLILTRRNKNITKYFDVIHSPEWINRMYLQSLPLEILFLKNECSSIIYKILGNPKKNLKQICTKQSNNTKVKKKFQNE